MRGQKLLFLGANIYWSVQCTLDGRHNSGADAPNVFRHCAMEKISRKYVTLQIYAYISNFMPNLVKLGEVSPPDHVADPGHLHLFTDFLSFVAE